MNSILLVGTGNMGKEYCRVLSAMKTKFVVIGRGIENTSSLKRTTGVNALAGGVEKNFDLLGDIPTHAIVAVGAYELYDVALFLIKKGIKKILLEKPGGTSKNQICDIAKLAQEEDADVYIAYNRRFYASVNKAIEIIECDGGVSSFTFEFTEWLRMFESRKRSLSLAQILYGNSSHVMDLAFFLGGKPTDISSYSTRDISWDSDNRKFVGAGITDKGAFFSYHANWDAPGRWGIEILTKYHRLYLRPLEKLSIQDKDSVLVKEVELNDSIDLEFKPGLYREVEAFLSKDLDERLISINEQIRNFSYFEIVLNGSGE